MEKHVCTLLFHHRHPFFFSLGLTYSRSALLQNIRSRHSFPLKISHIPYARQALQHWTFDRTTTAENQLMHVPIFIIQATFLVQIPSPTHRFVILVC